MYTTKPKGNIIRNNFIIMIILLITIAWLPKLSWSQEYQFTTLLQENSLEGWKTYQNKNLIEDSDMWTVEDGVLHAVSGKHPTSHWLVSDNTYGDFILRFELRHLSGNAGINFQSFFDDEDVQGPQMDISVGNTGRIYEVIMKSNNYTGKYHTEQTEQGTAVYKQGEWNSIEILRKGSNVRVRINGTITTDYDFPPTFKVRRGFFAWQIHIDNNMEYFVRNVEVSEWEEIPTSH